MRFSSAVLPIAYSASLCLVLVTGCATNSFTEMGASGSGVLPDISGAVHGGQQPVANSLIQLYATGSTTGGASSALIPVAVYTDVNGNFSISNKYSCPSASAPVYLVASGGNPGLTGTVNNAGLALMTALGPCGNLTANTFVAVNELTTVAAVEALAPFMTDYQHIGASPASASALTSAFADAGTIVSPGTGQVLTGANSVTLPVATYNTLADILAACVNSSGGTAGDSTLCGKLFGYAANGATTTNTINAMLHIAQKPTQNVSQLFALASANAVFAPGLTAVPASFLPMTTFALTGTGNNHAGDRIVVDTLSDVWVLQPKYQIVQEFDRDLALLHTINVGNATYSMHPDPQGNVWIYSYSGLIKISSSGVVLSPGGGFPFGTDPTVDTLLSYLEFSIDTSGNVWTIGIRNSDTAACLFEYSNAGTLLSPSTGYCGTPVANAAPTIANDASGNAYLFYTNGVIQKANSAGTFVTPAAGVTVGSFTNYLAVQFDPIYQRFWTFVSSSDGTYIASLTTNLTDAAGITSSSGPPIANPSVSGGLANDGAGNFWAAGGGSMGEASPSGVVLSPGYSASNPALYGYPVTTTPNLQALAIDFGGNLFTIDRVTPALVKIPGLAAVKQ